MTNQHNDFIFKTEGDKVTLIRDFEGMYRDCPDPHGQSAVMDNLSYQLVLTVLERAVKLLKPLPLSQVSIMDIGCGLGYFTAEVKKKFRDAHVCGVDISFSALERASQIGIGCDFFQVDLKTTEQINLGFQSNIAVALDCLYYFEEHEVDQVLSNIGDLIIEGGFILVGYHLPEEMNFGLYIRSLADAKFLFHSYGMRIVYSFEVENTLDTTYAGSPVGRHLYFLARKRI